MAAIPVLPDVLMPMHYMHWVDGMYGHSQLAHAPCYCIHLSIYIPACRERQLNRSLDTQLNRADIRVPRGGAEPQEVGGGGGGSTPGGWSVRPPRLLSWLTPRK
jgi:hypothetical protein